MLDEGRYRKKVQNMQKLGWKAQYLKSAVISMLGHSCDVSQYPPFYNTNIYINQMLQRPCFGSNVNEKGRQFFVETMGSCII